MKFSIGKFFAWILVGFLLLGLLGFGITDVLVGRNSNTIAKVGKSKISAQEFARSFQQELRFYSQQLGKDISIDEAKSLGIPQVVLGKLINGKILESSLKRIGLSRGDLAVSEIILRDKTFHDLSGTFSKDIYKSAISRAGLKLNEYEDLIRNELSSSLLLGVQKSSQIRNPFTVNLLAQYILEKRSGLAFTLDLSDTKNSYRIDTVEQKDFYQKNLETFRVPETSKISYAILSVKDMAEKIEIQDGEITQFYEDNISNIEREAAYNVDRMIFKLEAEALDSLKRITIGQTSFDELGQEKELSPEDLNLGFLRINEFEESAREQIESSEKGDIIGPLKSGLGYAIYRVNDFQPAFKPTIEELRDNIKTKLSYEKSYDRIDNIINDANEEIAAGANFEDLKKLGPFQQKELNYNSTATLPNYLENPEFKRFLASLEEYPSDILRLPNGSIITAKLENIRDSYIPEFDEIKDKIFDLLALERINQKLRTISESTQSDFSNSSLSAKPTLEEFKEEIFNDIDRSFSNATLTSEIVENVFKIEKKYGFYSNIVDGKLTLFQLTDILEFDETSELTKSIILKIQKNLRSQIQNDIGYYFINSLRENVEIDVNSVAIDNILSRF